jgi:hypothetical protein
MLALWMKSQTRPAYFHFIFWTAQKIRNENKFLCDRTEVVPRIAMRERDLYSSNWLLQESENESSFPFLASSFWALCAESHEVDCPAVNILKRSGQFSHFVSSSACAQSVC